MVHSRKLFAALILLSTVANAQPPAGSSDATSFLNLNGDYILRFAVGDNPFSVSKTDASTVSKTKEGVTVGPWTINYSVNVFTIVEKSGESWALVEHPADIEQSFNWNAKRLAIAALNKETIARLQASGEGRKKLEELRKQADEKITTARTWINLRHVVAIQTPPTTPPEMKLNVTVTQK